MQQEIIDLTCVFLSDLWLCATHGECGNPGRQVTGTREFHGQWTAIEKSSLPPVASVRTKCVWNRTLGLKEKLGWEEGKGREGKEEKEDRARE